jgi:hypothetical protein
VQAPEGVRERDRIAWRHDDARPRPDHKALGFAACAQQQRTPSGHCLQQLGRECPLEDWQVAEQHRGRVGPRVQAGDQVGRDGAQHPDVVDRSSTQERADRRRVGAVAGDRRLHDRRTGQPRCLHQHVQPLSQADRSGEQDAQWP